MKYEAIFLAKIFELIILLYTLINRANINHPQRRKTLRVAQTDVSRRYIPLKIQNSNGFRIARLHCAMIVDKQRDLSRSLLTLAKINCLVPTNLTFFNSLFFQKKI